MRCKEMLKMNTRTTKLLLGSAGLLLAMALPALARRVLLPRRRWPAR